MLIDCGVLRSGSEYFGEGTPSDEAESVTSTVVETACSSMMTAPPPKRKPAPVSVSSRRSACYTG